MARRKPDLLQEIEADALDSNSDLASVLRKCVALGGATGSESLRAWATRELKGYSADDVLPAYRKVEAPLLLDAVLGGRTMVQSQTMPPSLIPEFARDTVNTSVHFPQAIAEVAAMIGSASSRGSSSVQLGPPGGSHIVQYINAQMVANDENHQMGLAPSQLIERIYWSVSLASLQRILDVVRTTLVELTAEMRAGTPADQAAPSREVAEQAVSVAVHGKRNRVVINQVGSDGTAAAAAGAQTSIGAEAESPQRRVMWWLVALATIVAAVAAVWVIVF